MELAIYAEVLTSCLNGGMADGEAAWVAREVETRVRERYGGRRVYIAAPTREERNAAIRKEYNGRNRDEICRRWGISRTTLYRLLGERTKSN